MLVYLTSFSVALTIIWIIQNWPRKSTGFIFWSSAAILVPCLIAGMRDLTVGTDVLGYAKPLFDLARNSDGFFDYYNSHWYRVWRDAGPQDFEIGYVVLVWLSAKVFDSFQTLLFITELLSIGPVYLALARCRKRISLPIGMGVYLFLYFNLSLNMMRQWIALAFVFLAIMSFYARGRKLKMQKKSILLIMLAMTFHITAIIGFVLLIILVFVGKSSKVAARRSIIVCVLFLVAVFSLEFVKYLLNAIGFGYYAGYLGHGMVSLMPMQIILRAPVLFLSLYLVLTPSLKNEFNIVLLTFVVVGIILSQLVSLGENSGRIALYFDMFSMVVLPLACSELRNNAVAAVFAKTGVATYLACYWLYFYVYTNSSQTIPYLFFWE